MVDFIAIAIRAKDGVVYWHEMPFTHEKLRKALNWHDIDLDESVEGYLNANDEFVEV